MVIEDVTVEPRTVEAGGTVDVTVTVRNTDNLSQEEEFRLLIDGRTVDRQVAWAWGGETTQIVFQRTFQQPGEYDVQVDLHEAGSVTVTDPTGGGAGFEVTNASVEPAIVRPGGTVTVSADVRNLGDEAGTFRAELSVGGTVVDTQPVEVPAGGTVRVSFERTFDRRGGYDVAIGGRSAGTVQVESATGSVVRRYGSQYGWLVGVFSAPVGGGALVAVRRRRRTPE